MTGRLAGKVALITGTGTGQGRAAALRFTEEGARVVSCDIIPEHNAETIRLVRERGGEMVGMAPVDLGDPDQAVAWVNEAAAVHGRVDILYNNAATAKLGDTELMTHDEYRFTMRNEVDLVFYVTKAAWPYLRASRGVILTTASVAGHRGIPSNVAHCAGKGAVLAMSRAFAVDGAADGIRAITISPGPIFTEGAAEYFADPDNMRRSVSGTLLQRLGTPDEIARTAVFLASEEAAYMTGTDVSVDGGRMC